MDKIFLDTHLSITTPALLFPAISLLLVAYSNRFDVLAKVIRHLISENDPEFKGIHARQIPSLQMRLHLIQAMQFAGVLAFILCTLSMCFIFLEKPLLGKITFAISLLLLVTSLVVSLVEIHVSTRAINIELEKLRE